MAGRIQIYTDGACSGNPGPGGLGVVWVRDGQAIEYAESVPGPVTNSYTELLAVRRALERLTSVDKLQPITIYTDSQYVVNVLALNYRAKVHVELIQYIKFLLASFLVEIIRVPGHADQWGNERADALARGAVQHG